MTFFDSEASLREWDKKKRFEKIAFLKEKTLKINSEKSSEKREEQQQLEENLDNKEKWRVWQSPKVIEKEKIPKNIAENVEI